LAEKRALPRGFARAFKVHESLLKKTKPTAPFRRVRTATGHVRPIGRVHRLDDRSRRDRCHPKPAGTDPAAAAQIADQFGFDGSNQTIAIIDSGIAFTHSAFGGGFGEGFRVVGGFDFAENDANPFDDGPAGFHGTNVAGIAASGDETFRGVASGADLVALRVFDDNGRGDITYVESALQYVLENINTFEHPITTVNLSLGIDADSPEASRAFIIEDELAALEEAGVFISVAAGNNFEDLQTTGLALPAASEFVVPVASSNSLFSDPDANEFFLSDFSQRDSRVLVAPGERITSAVPESLFGGLQENPVLGLSGTSQAAPYVAGASAILREAYAFVGTPDVDQTTIYETFLATADDIFDPITNQTYSRVNLEAALESVVQDQHGDSQVSATDFGQLEGGELLRGTIGKANDVDFFSFQASANGQVELGFEASHDLEPQIEVTDANGNAVDIRIDGGRVFFDVVEGTDYFIGISGAAGNGHYEVTTQFQSSGGSGHWRIFLFVFCSQNRNFRSRIRNRKPSRRGSPRQFHEPYRQDLDRRRRRGQSAT